MAMAVFLRFLLSVCLCLLIFSSMKGYALDERQATENHQTLTIQLNSLLPSAVCSLSTEVSGMKSSMEVVHKHGPCSRLNGDKAKSPSHTEILLEDQSRVKLIQSILSKNSSRGDIKETDAVTLPANDGRILGSGNYFVTLGLGSPKKDLSLIFDTGSGLTWTQCEPCPNCYQQVETKFDPGMSKTYSNISCQSESCNSLASATGYAPNCESSTCVYKIRYGDSSFSIGYFGKDALTLSSSDVFPDFLFGCGQDNEGLFRGVAGLLGLARDQISLVSQTAQKYNKFFSYCLPSSPSSTGRLTFGNAGGHSNSVKFTPLSTNSPRSSFYGVDITAISVGGQTLSIPSSVFSESGTIIDSGTVITRLPPDAYSALRSAFRQLMTMYPMAPPQSLLDTCYDFSGYDTVNVPTISFSFNGGVVVNVDVSGILYILSPSEVCLAFAGNSDPSEVAIFGNSQQKTLEVVYDVGGGRVGFAAGGCT